MSTFTRLAVLFLLAIAGDALADEPIRIFFLHNSVGRGLIEQGGMREYLETHNAHHKTFFRLWDHNYPYIGLSNAEGALLGYAYSSACGHNTNPDGLHLLWLNTSIQQYTSARDSIMNNHDIIAFKSCYRAVDFGGAETEPELQAALENYKTLYLEMRDFFDEHQDKIFVVISPPPRHRLHPGSSIARAAHGRLFANWLKSEEYLGNPPRQNVAAFDLFDLLATPDDGQPAANMLRYQYEISHSSTDSHPNALANATVGQLMMQFYIDLASALVPAQNMNWSQVRNTFR